MLTRREFLIADKYVSEYGHRKSIVKCPKCETTRSVATADYYKKRLLGLVYCRNCTTPHKETDEQIISRSGSKITVKCASCEKPKNIAVNNYRKIKRRDGTWSCYECRKPAIIEQSKTNPKYKSEEYRKQFRTGHAHDDETKSKIASGVRKSWKSRNRTLDEKRKQHISKISKQLWESQQYRAKQHKARSSDAYRLKASKRSKKLWQNPEYRTKITKVLNKSKLNSAPKTTVSSLQKILYSILDELGVTYYQEGPQTTIGPITTSKSEFDGYRFDCLVIHNNIKLFIECNGDYWHKSNVRIGRNQSKATFLKKYFPSYDLMTLWEYEFRSHTKIRQIIAEKLKINEIEMIDFAFSDVIVNVEPEIESFKSFVSTNHYLANIGRYGSIRISAEIDDKIAAAAIFCHPTRKESYSRLGLCKNEMLELTRFCISPKYQKKNFASWFLSRCINHIRNKYSSVRMLLSFADSTFDHVGTIYKATNWDLDGTIKPDYWYTDGKAWYHKKSIWDMASKNSEKESEYAEKHGLHKVTGKEKYRYVYKIK